MILLYHFLTKNERIYISVAFLVAALLFWNILPSHHQVSLTFLPLAEFELKTHFLNSNNEISNVTTILWITSGQDIQNAHLYQSSYSAEDQPIIYYIKNKIDKNLDRIIPSEYPQILNDHFVTKTSNLDKSITICDLDARDYHISYAGEFGFPNWWHSLLGKERKIEWNEGKEDSLECPNPFSYASIGRVAWEYEIFPPSLLSRVNLMDQIWVPSNKTRAALIAAGVETNIITIPLYTNTSFWDPSLYIMPSLNDTTFRFVINFIDNTENRKIHFLIHSYLDEFSPHDNVELAIITNVDNNLRNMVISYTENRPLNVLQEEPEKEWPIISYHSNVLNDDSLAQLYNTYNCFLYTAEFRTYPGEAMSMEIPSITNTPTEFMSDTNSYIIPKSELPLDLSESDITTKLSQKFRVYMRRAFSNPTDVKEKGEKGRQDLIKGLQNNPKLIHDNIQELRQKNIKKKAS